MAKRVLQYIKVKRNDKIYKLYLKDIKKVTRLERKERPSVPIFKEKEIIENNDKSIANTRDSIGSEISGTNSFDIQDLMQFPPFIV